MTSFIFEKRPGRVKRVQKFQKIWWKWDFVVFAKNIIHLHMYFFLENESTNSPLTFWKNWPLSYDQITSWPIRMQYSINYNVSKTNWGLKLNFWKWLTLFQVGMITSTCTYPNWWKKWASLISRVSCCI